MPRIQSENSTLREDRGSGLLTSVVEIGVFLTVLFTVVQFALWSNALVHLDTTANEAVRVATGASGTVLSEPNISAGDQIISNLWSRSLGPTVSSWSERNGVLSLTLTDQLPSKDDPLLAIFGMNSLSVHSSLAVE